MKKDIETVRVFFVNESFCLFKRRTDTFFQFVQKSGLERHAKKSIVEMLHNRTQTKPGTKFFDLFSLSK